MSSTDTLSPYTRDRDKYGPAQIKQATIRFEQRLRGVLGRINALIKEAIVEDDIFDLKGDSTDTLAPEKPGPFETTSDAAKTAKFLQWLKRQLDNELLTVVGPEENPFITTAYAQGIRLGTRELQKVDFEVTTTDIEELMEKDRFDRGLRTIFNRVYENLQSITDAMIPAVRNELMEGFREGENPNKVARRITDRIDKIGKHRATLLARTEMINAHTDASLDRYEQAADETDADLGVQHVAWQTAADEDVCPYCRRLGDETFTIPEMRGHRSTFRGQTYQLRPPAHPNGRCVLLPKPGITQGDLKPLSERVPGQLVL